jgi:hypothetical protein
MNSDPAQLLKNLSNTDFWNPLETDSMTDRDWIGLRNPIVLNVKNLQVRVIRIFRDRSANVWKISAHASDLPDLNLAFKFEDNELYQYILICGKKVKAGTIFELPLLKAFKSTYFRQNRRFAVRDQGWYLSDLILPAEEINVQKRKSSIAVILQTYAKLSPLDMKTAHLDFFNENDSAILKYIRISGNGFAIKDSGRNSGETTRIVEFFSHKYSFVPLAEAVPEGSARADIIDHYKMAGIVSEAIFPISVPRKDGTSNPIAYIRCHFRNHAENITDQLLQTMISIAEAVATSVRNSNFERYPVKETAIDASLTGIKVQVRDPKARRALSQVSSFRATLFTGYEARALEVRLEKMQQVTFDDVDFIGCRIAEITRKSHIDEKTDSKETGIKAYRAALNSIKTA